MKIIITLIQVLLSLLFFLDLFFWAALYGSGHRVPQKTETTIIQVAGLLILLLIVSTFIRRRLNR